MAGNSYPEGPWPQRRPRGAIWGQPPRREMEPGSKGQEEDLKGRKGKGLSSGHLHSSLLGGGLLLMGKSSLCLWGSGRDKEGMLAGIPR